MAISSAYDHVVKRTLSHSVGESLNRYSFVGRLDVNVYQAL